MKERDDNDVINKYVLIWLVLKIILRVNLYKIKYQLKIYTYKNECFSCDSHCNLHPVFPTRDSGFRHLSCLSESHTLLPMHTILQDTRKPPLPLYISTACQGWLPQPTHWMGFSALQGTSIVVKTKYRGKLWSMPHTEKGMWVNRSCGGEVRKSQQWLNPATLYDQCNLRYHFRNGGTNHVKRLLLVITTL